MMRGERVIVRVPATSANLGPGFDTLGMALCRYLWVEMQFAEKLQIEVYGENARYVARDHTNLIYRAAQRVLAKAGSLDLQLQLAIYSEIPLSRGLGSSAAAIIAGMVAANALIGKSFSQEELFTLATELEGHPDNVGAALYGGIVVSMWDGFKCDHIKLTPPSNLSILLTVPNYTLSTKRARNALPRTVPIEDAVFNISHVALLVAAFASGDLTKITLAMQDRLHQPHRAKLVPGMKSILEEATQYGALGVALSGAGPSLIAFVDHSLVAGSPLVDYLRNTLLAEGITADLYWLEADPQGATLVDSFPIDRERFLNE